MRLIRKTLGVIALTALVVGMVCGVLSKGSDTVAWWWLAAAVTGLLWDILRAYQTDWVRDPITLPPSRTQRHSDDDYDDAAELRAHWDTNVMGAPE